MKIQKIVLNNFRGFPGPLDYEFKLDGKNLLLYGENGSGKSSLYRALVELFQPEWFPVVRVPLQPPVTIGQYRSFADFRNIFTKDTATNSHLPTGKVQVLFDTANLRAEWSETIERSPLEEAAPIELNLTARSMACLDYRAMLQTNFVHRHDRINLFSLVVEHLLAHAPVTVSWPKVDTLSKAWKFVKASKPKNHRGTRWISNTEFVKDFWNTTLAPLMSLLNARANQYINYFFGSEIAITLTPSLLEYKKASRQFEGQEIWLDITFHGKPIPEPQNFLNEARLSALALSLFLAGYDLSVPKANSGEPDRARVLVLDDVLIGLDYPNRRPLLKLLSEKFQDWQILLFTHDPVWFELVKEQTEASGNWQHTKLFAVVDAGNGLTYPRIHDDPKKQLAVARKHLEDHDLKSAAVHTRSALEMKLRSFCSKRSIKVCYQANPKEVKADALWSGIKERNTELLGKGKSPLLAQELINDIEAIRSVVLNELSHSRESSLTSKELGEAIATVEAFLAIPNRAAAEVTS